jgi:hypothetical protein
MQLCHCELARFCGDQDPWAPSEPQVDSHHYMKEGQYEKHPRGRSFRGPDQRHRDDGPNRASVLECKPAERHGWFKQLELSLDGYGGALSQRAERMRALIKQVETEMATESALPGSR